MAHRLVGAVHNQIAACINGLAGKGIFRGHAGVVAERPSRQINRLIGTVVQLNPVIRAALDFLHSGNLADKNPRIVETADLLGCFKSVCIIAARRWRSEIAYVLFVVQPNGDIVPVDSRERETLRSHAVETGEEYVIFLVGEAKVRVQLPVCAVFAGKKDDFAFAGLQRYIRKRPFIEIRRLIRKEISQQRNGCAGEVLDLCPLLAIAVGVDCGERVILEHLVEMHRITLFHHRDRKVGKRQRAVCGLKGWIRGIYACPRRILNGGDALRNAGLPTDAVDRVPLQIGKQQHRVILPEAEGRVHALLGIAAEAGEIDGGIAARGHRAGGNLPLKRICLVVRKAVVLKADCILAAVIELYPAVTACVVRRHHFAD
ncbi:hypothetical protein SDC9_96231 [bioreactor metagenome]|uniref:Uncharacterized protein n=1 Tax=bioreactor metagenome TaxID=1076179 RepID=A0A645AB31_9ZZZZ